MKTRLLSAILALLLTAWLAASAQQIPGGGAVYDQAPQMRTLTGQVMNPQDKPLPDSIVYLKNTKTMAIKTFIAGPDGVYRFNALSPNVDYEVYAEHNGKRSDTKTLSSFDSRKTATINLKVKE